MSLHIFTYNFRTKQFTSATRTYTVSKQHRQVFDHPIAAANGLKYKRLGQFQYNRAAKTAVMVTTDEWYATDLNHFFKCVVKRSIDLELKERAAHTLASTLRGDFNKRFASLDFLVKSPFYAVEPIKAQTNKDNNG
jgi:hypothetical protein